MSQKSCCCSNLQEPETTVGKRLNELNDGCAVNEDSSVPELISSPEETFNMGTSLQLTESAKALWEMHKSVINETINGGWDNSVHPWPRAMQSFWKYSLAFSSYGIPSLMIIDNSRFKEACECLRKSILLMKDVGAWDGWIRVEWGKDPVTTKNIMYKGHLNLMYGLYKLVSGSDEFEVEHQRLTEIMTSEMEYNCKHRGFWGIECEPDQYFPPCNSVALMSLKIYDKIYQTDYNNKYCIPTVNFIKTKLTDPETGIHFFRYHPSHDFAEPYFIGDFWTLSMIRIYDPEHFQRAYENSKKYFIGEIKEGKECYLKASRYSEGASSDYEQSTFGFYVPFASKEFNDHVLWEKISRFYRDVYETYISEGLLRFGSGSPQEETYVSNYLFLGDIHLGWERIVNYDWKALQSKYGDGNI